MYTLLNMKLYAQAKLARFFSEENGEVNIVATVVLIGIAVVLAMFFRTEIKKLLDTLFTAIQTTANKAVAE